MSELPRSAVDLVNEQRKAGETDPWVVLTYLAQLVDKLTGHPEPETDEG